MDNEGKIMTEEEQPDEEQKKQSRSRVRLRRTLDRLGIEGTLPGGLVLSGQVSSALSL
jgi:hypothetical protein